MFEVDGKGNPISSIYIDKSQITVMLKTISVLETISVTQAKEMDGWVSVKKVHKTLQKFYPMLACNTLQRTLTLLAGALYIDIKNEENCFEKLPIKKIHLMQAMNHHKLNLNSNHTKIPLYLKGTRYVRLAPKP